MQEIPVQGFGMVASFSPNGECLALGTSEGIYSIVRMGPLLGINLAPLDLKGGVEQLPAWALNEVLFRSGDGPSFIQRHMRKGDQDNLQRVAKLLELYPDAIYTFDRNANEGCFDTALLLRKPNLLKLAVSTLVDGTLKLNSDAILTSSIPIKAKGMSNQRNGDETINRRGVGKVMANRVHPHRFFFSLREKFPWTKSLKTTHQSWSWTFSEI